MIRSVLRLKPRPSREDDVLSFYESRGILARAMADGGCAAAEIHLRLPARDEVVVSALWHSAADYERWAGSTQRASDAGDLEALLIPESLPLGPGDVYEVVAVLPGAPS